MFDPSDDFPDVVDGAVAVTLRRPDDAAQAVAARRQTPDPPDRRPLAAHRAGLCGRPMACAGRGTARRAATRRRDRRERRDGVDGDRSDRRARGAVDGAARPAGRWISVPDAYVDIEQAAYAKGPSGAETAVWNTWKTGVPGTIRPAASAMSDDGRGGVAVGSHDDSAPRVGRLWRSWRSRRCRRARIACAAPRRARCIASSPASRSPAGREPKSNSWLGNRRTP